MGLSSSVLAGLSGLIVFGPSSMTPPASTPLSLLRASPAPAQHDPLVIEDETEVIARPDDPLVDLAHAFGRPARRNILM